MMRKAKRILAALAALTMTVSALPTMTYAADTDMTLTDSSEKVKDDFDNDDYKEYIKLNFWEMPCEKDVIEYVNTVFYKDIKHVYRFGYGNILEYEPEAGKRTFVEAVISYPESVDIVGDADTAIKKLEKFLKDNSINAEIEVSSDKKSFSLKFDEKCTEGDKARTFTEIKKNDDLYFEVSLMWGFLSMPFETFTEGADHSESSISDVYGTEDTPSYKSDINNPAYEKYLGRWLCSSRKAEVEKYELIKDKELYKLVNKCNKEAGKIPKSEDDPKPFGENIINIYYHEDKQLHTDHFLFFEFEMPDGSRTLVTNGELGLTEFNCWNDAADDVYTEEELNNFIKKNGYDMTIQKYRNSKTASDTTARKYHDETYCKVTYGDKYSIEDILEISLKMRDELGIEDPIVRGYNTPVYFKDNADYGFYVNGTRIYLDGSAGDEKESVNFNEAGQEEESEVHPVCIVIGVSDDEVILDYGCHLSQESYKKLSGNDNELKYGDVIEVKYGTIQPEYPGNFVFDKNSYIKYLGTASELYKDSIKELTVTECGEDIFTLTDSKGSEYTADYNVNENYGFKNDFGKDDVKVGNKYNCYVKENKAVLPLSEEYIPYLDEVQGVFLTGDADLNGYVELADLVSVAKNVLSDVSFPLKNSVAYKNADMNGDGKVDGLDVSALIENQLGKKKTDPSPEPAGGSKTVELTADLRPVSIETKKPTYEFNNSQTDFALSLLQNSVLEDKNTLVSPYSVSQALAMTANGADNNTLKEMMKVIGGGMDISKFNKQMAGYRKDQPNNDRCKIQTANSIWYTNDTNKFVADEDFLLTGKSYYDAQIFSASLDSNTVKDVNSWVEKHTDGMIPSIIDKFEENSIMTLVNAVTFDAKWACPYYDSVDSKNFFTAFDGKKQDAKILSEMSDMPYFTDNGTTGFLKYYADGRYAFAAILPKEGTSVTDYVKGLTAKKFSSLLRSARSEEVKLTMPKFKTEFDSSLVEQLKLMGIKDAFELGTADFSKMGKSDLGGIYIGDVLHKTFIDVNETGTRAAAATAVEMAAGCALIEDYKTVTLNRPFVYAIVDTQSNIPIFIGTLLTLE